MGATGTQVTARACANIALVKYWGKRDAALNLPAAGSLSLTLAALVTETRVQFDSALDHDVLALDGRAADAARVTPFLDLVRARAALSTKARVISTNRFPTASGLASSASGFAALAVAATRAAGLTLPARELSILARRGSGSAARSIFGGFVRMHAGTAASGEDAYAEPLESALASQVRMVIGVVGGGAPKSHGSRDAMDHTAATSPFYAAWIALVPRDLVAAEAALVAGDLQALGELAEANALAMHASAIAARPGVVYWQPTTLALLAAVRDLRATGVPAWATMDAGPHVKVLTTADAAPRVAEVLGTVGGVTTMISEVGTPAELVEETSS
jgi:diphosphomevalonate decarboxylase